MTILACDIIGSYLGTYYFCYFAKNETKNYLPTKWLKYESTQRLFVERVRFYRLQN